MKIFTHLLFGFALLGASSLAIASDGGLYLGINAVKGNIDLNDLTVNGITYTPSDTNTFGGGITAGINASPYFAIETAFDGLNKVDYEGDNAPTENYWFTYLAIKPMLPIWKFNLHALLGAAYVDISQNNSGDTEDTSSSQVSPFWGAGLGINFTPAVELDISINQIHNTNTPITFGMLTLSYHFITHHEDSGFLAD